MAGAARVSPRCRMVGALPRALRPGDEGHDDVGRVAIEVQSSPVIDRGGPRVGVSGRELGVPKRNGGVERRHDEGRAEHVRMHETDACLLADRTHPAVSGAPVEAVPVTSHQDGTVTPFTDRQVDRAGRSRHERDDPPACSPCR